MGGEERRTVFPKRGAGHPPHPVQPNRRQLSPVRAVSPVRVARQRSDEPPRLPQIGMPADTPTVPQISVPAPQIHLNGKGPANGSSFAAGAGSNVSNGTRSPFSNGLGPHGKLACGGCGEPIVGKTVSAMGVRWHPACFRCCECGELLEYVSSYEHEGRPYCHLDYHEKFAPRCFHCKTAIVDERFITLDDAELGKRTYHEQHFFCAECGDPFLTPTIPSTVGGGERTFTGDGDFDGGEDVAFTVYRGHPYCEPCHVRLRSPRCKGCKKGIRDGAQAVEALGGKWHWECFVCTGCENPFDTPSFFLRSDKPFCEACFSIIIKNEM
ncbi:hypothetical protein K488DRAFT_90353 [Vararia minispora EC-137]|uniref:Uncharacterized protein n=1 Tax=Vararia minispora EC-137 TaxID=1314806 RepID=A0ACB8Q7W9_9AGAM|nr:hypothetical protein K488DRAFT_90353 [Vararia minispora EC-137]